jgi:hypothetical protein
MQLHDAYNECLRRLRIAAQKLDITANETELQRISELVVQPLTGPWRQYHTIEHIFEVGGDDDPLEMIAALFHDVVYIQIDLSINFNLARFITPFVREVKPVKAGLTEGLVVRERDDIGDDRLFTLVATVFGIAPGERLEPQAGQNEFLSALVAAKVLEKAFPLAVIAQVIACIEATIPFRAPPPPGTADHSEQLHQRLCRANLELALGLDAHGLREAVRRAVRLANRDVEGFASSNPAQFLDNTWNLLPETNHALLTSTAYTVRDYRVSMQRMHGFLQRLEPSSVFRRFADEPAEAVHRERLARVAHNLAIASRYLGAKLVTIAFLEALSMRIGPDLPLSMIMGALPRPDAPPGPTLEGFLPPAGKTPAAASVLESTVLRLLEFGRESDRSYDLKHSPLAAYLALELELGPMLELLQSAEALFTRLDSSDDDIDTKRECCEGFLALFPEPVAETVIACALQVLLERSLALQAVR